MLVHARPLQAVLVGALALAAPWAGAQSRDKDSGKTTAIYRCDNGGSTTYSDVQQRCPGGVVSTQRATPASGPIIGPATARVSLSGPPCPQAVPDPEGLPWASVRNCYTAALMGQPTQRVPEAQLAGVLMGQCEAETQRLASAKLFVDELGRLPDERRQSIRRWSQWLVQQSGAASDSMPVQVVTLGKPAPISRLNGPLEVQATDGQLTEAFNGTLVRPGQQLYVRRGVSLQLGGASIAAQAQRERCVRLD